jgi:hypothetical protein
MTEFCQCRSCVFLREVMGLVHEQPIPFALTDLAKAELRTERELGRWPEPAEVLPSFGSDQP